MRYFYNPVVTGGCPHCGTYLYNQPRNIVVNKRKRLHRFNRHFSPEDSRFIRFARCGFVCNLKRDIYANKGGRMGWGQKYVETGT